MADLLEPPHQPLRNAPRPIRRDIEEVIRLPGIAELEHIHNLRSARHVLFRSVGLPIPGTGRNAVTDLGGIRVVFGRQYLALLGLQPRIFVAVNIGLLEVGGVVGEDEAVGLERMDVCLDLTPLCPCVFVFILIKLHQIHRAVLGQQFGQLQLDELDVIARRFRRHPVKVGLAGLQLIFGVISRQAIVESDP